MGWFSKKKPEPEMDWKDAVEEKLVELNELLEQRPPAYAKIRPFVPAPNYDRHYVHTVTLAQWDSRRNGWDIVFDPQSR